MELWGSLPHYLDDYDLPDSLLTTEPDLSLLEEVYEPVILSEMIYTTDLDFPTMTDQHYRSRLFTLSSLRPSDYDSDHYQEGE